MRTKRRIAWASSTDVPPNFITRIPGVPGESLLAPDESFMASPFPSAGKEKPTASYLLGGGFGELDLGAV
jgi:hypothetical protein